jgi:hypothetical protein
MQVSKQKLSRRAALTILIGGAGGAALIGGATGIVSLNAEPAADRGQVTLYKNPECGCCEGYADYAGAGTLLRPFLLCQPCPAGAVRSCFLCSGNGGGWEKRAVRDGLYSRSHSP